MKHPIPDQHIVLDIETLSTRPGALILSIGAVLLTRSGIEDTFYRVIDSGSSARAGLRCDIPTITWWISQDKAAQAHAFDSAAAINIHLALREFHNFLPTHTNYWLWGNGADFDNAILEAAYQAIKAPLPWKYFQNRCLRTLRALHPDLEPPAFPAEHIKHHALHDAQHEAEHLYEILVDSYGF